MVRAQDLLGAGRVAVPRLVDAAEQQGHDLEVKFAGPRLGAVEPLAGLVRLSQAGEDGCRVRHHQEPAAVVVAADALGEGEALCGDDGVAADGGEQRARPGDVGECPGIAHGPSDSASRSAASAAGRFPAYVSISP